MEDIYKIRFVFKYKDIIYSIIDTTIDGYHYKLLNINSSLFSSNNIEDIDSIKNEILHRFLDARYSKLDVKNSLCIVDSYDYNNDKIKIRLRLITNKILERHDNEYEMISYNERRRVREIPFNIVIDDIENVEFSVRSQSEEDIVVTEKPKLMVLENGKVIRSVI